MSARRHRFFDAAVEEPDLLKADHRARRRRQMPNGPGEQRTRAPSGSTEGKAQRSSGTAARKAQGSSGTAPRKVKASGGTAARKAQGSGGGAARKAQGSGGAAARKAQGPSAAAPRKARRATESGAAGSGRSQRSREQAEQAAAATGEERRQTGSGARNGRRAASRLGSADRAASAGRASKAGAAQEERSSAKRADGRASASALGRSATARAASGRTVAAAGPSEQEGDRSGRAGLMRRSGGTEVPRRGRRARKERAGKVRAGAGARRRGSDATRSQDTAIDPRIAARRASVQAEEAAAGMRRRRRMAMVTMALVVLTVVGALVLLSPVAGVRTIEVAGAGRTGAEAVRKASGLTPGRPLLRIDEERVTARVAKLPWVNRVRFERRWPHTVVVTVDERQPAAIVPCHGRSATCLVDAGGRVLAPTGAVPRVAADLPRLAGVPAAGEPGVNVPVEARAALAVAVSLPPALRPLVLGVRGEGSDVSLDLRAPGRDDTPPVVRLGSADRLPDKLTAAATVLARTSVNGVAVLDVRVPESPALTRVRR